MVPDPVGVTYDGTHLLVLDESGAIYRVEAETGDTGYLFSAPDMVNDNTYAGPEGISYIAGFIVIGYGAEKKILFGELVMPSNNCAGQGEMCAGIAGIPCCDNLSCHSFDGGICVSNSPCCVDMCGDGICGEYICKLMSPCGCPCSETAESCPEDCNQ
ncbi:MAG: hypothetical protein GY864_13635 [Desulfobacterales bacterium]|nr:hypothetical protein [Desulfobacterales bacterium]